MYAFPPCMTHDTCDHDFGLPQKKEAGIARNPNFENDKRNIEYDEQ